MATYRSQFLQLMRDQEAALTALFFTAAQQIAYQLQRYADPVTGEVPPDKQKQVEQQILSVLHLIFLVNSRAEGLSAFTVNPLTGAYLPQSPFAEIVWDTARRAGQIAVDQQVGILRTALRRHPDLIDTYTNARVNPFAADAPLTDAQRRVFGGYVPPQDVVFDSGRSLEDSVIAAATETRRRVRLYLRTLFAERRSVRDIADALTAFLTPDNLIPRHNQLFGRNGVVLATQIARSLPVLTNAVVGRSLAALNPFIAQIRIERTRSTPCSVCDPIVAGSPYPIDVATQFLPGYHANCRCVMIYELVGNPSAVIERLRGDDADMLTVRGALSADVLELLLRSQVGLVR